MYPPAQKQRYSRDFLLKKYTNPGGDCNWVGGEPKIGTVQPYVFYGMVPFIHPPSLGESSYGGEVDCD